MLWTRRPPVSGSEASGLVVEVARDDAFRNVVARGRAALSADNDWTCRFLAAGLRPSREYFYRFVDEHGFASRVGRTLTAPAENADVPVRFAFVSCQDPTQGGLQAWRKMIFEDMRRSEAERLKFVLHLGDFIYEIVWYPEDRPNGRLGSRRLRDLVRYPHGEKIRDFHVPTNVEDYRTAYRAYLTDPDLQDARARWPFVNVWDNHEFSWQGFQSIQAFNGPPRAAATRKVAANQAWFEYQPARVRQVDGVRFDKFAPPAVTDAAAVTDESSFDPSGISQEPNNLAAINSLLIYRTLRWGKHASLTLTDNRSFQAPGRDGSAFAVQGYNYFLPQDANDAIDIGRAYRGGHPPQTIRFNDRDVPNPSINLPPTTTLGPTQRAWFIEQLRSARTTWKIWGHSFGTLQWRTDLQNLPADFRPAWPSQSYGLMNDNFRGELYEIFDVVKNEGITNFAVVAGDKHSFWAGKLTKELPPDHYDPIGVEFITGSISAVGFAEAVEGRVAHDDPLRVLYLHDRPDGSVQPAINMTVRHGVRSTLELQRTGDVAAARALSNPDVAPHLAFADYGGHGYTTVRVDGHEMETEFVCIPRPLERIDAPDGGPLSYRVVHRVRTWARGERPELRQEVVEGEPPLSI